MSGMHYICILQTIFDWMTVWIQKSQENGCSLTWDSIALLVKEVHRNGHPNVMPMVLDVEHGLRDRKVH